MFNKIKKILLSKEFQKYFVIGVGGFLIDLGLLSFQVYVLKFNLTVLGFIFVPNIISAGTSIIISFFAQRHWAFTERSKDKAYKEMMKYVSVQIFNLILFNTIIFGIVAKFGVPILLDKVGVTFLQMFSSYALYKYFVFGGKKQKLP